jgi:Tol biopolymer transport system component
MRDMKDDLERAARSYPPPTDSLERLLRRRDRRRTASRFAAAGVAGVLGLLAVLLLVVTFGGHEAARTTTPGRAPDPVTNGRIAFTRRLSTEWNVFTVDPDGSGEQHVTHGVRDYSTSWSPDGSRIVVDRENGLTVMDADGSNPVVIADAGEGSFPSWSPDGTKILFTRWDGGDELVRVGEGSAASSTHLFVVAPDGTDPQQLTSGLVIDSSGAWSPDGSQIAFTRVADTGTGLYVMNADGSDPVLVLPAQDPDPSEPSWFPYAPYEPAWSPDGSRIAFSMNAQHSASIYVMDADGSGVVQLTDGQNYDTAPVWSPDGTLIAFSREISGPGDISVTGDIYVMRADGTHVTQLTDTPGEDEQVPSWGTAPAMAP